MEVKSIGWEAAEDAVTSAGTCPVSQSVSQASAADNITSSSHRFHTLYAASAGLHGIFYGLTHITTDTHKAHKRTHRHKQPQQCCDVAIANEAWQEAS